MIETRSCRATDGTKIVYSAAGSGEPALIFIHGGLANRGFWEGELREFAARHRVIAPDLAGHGDSGTDRRTWGIPEFGGDVRSVAEVEHVRTAMIFGNSMGGPVAIEAALLLPGCAAVVGIDTFQTLEYTYSLEEARKRAEAFRTDFDGSLREMVKMLFHPDADPAIMADAERRMANTSPEAAYNMFRSFGGYDTAAAARRLTVPLRAINGDLFPTDINAIRRIKRDFDAVIMKHMGHYPMLERPAEFDRLVSEMIAGLT